MKYLYTYSLIALLLLFSCRKEQDDDAPIITFTPTKERINVLLGDTITKQINYVGENQLSELKITESSDLQGSKTIALNNFYGNYDYTGIIDSSLTINNTIEVIFEVSDILNQTTSKSLFITISEKVYKLDSVSLDPLNLLGNNKPIYSLSLEQTLSTNDSVVYFDFCNFVNDSNQVCIASPQFIDNFEILNFNWSNAPVVTFSKTNYSSEYFNNISNKNDLLESIPSTINDDIVTKIKAGDIIAFSKNDEQFGLIKIISANSTKILFSIKTHL